MSLSTDSSPFQSSPLDRTTSPRLFWQNRSNVNSENSLYGRGGSPSPTRRSSIERLQKASRVKNSNILALEHKQEYDPTKIPHLERPLARPRQGNAFGGTSINPLRSSPEGRGHQRSDSKTSIPLFSPTKPASTIAPPTPTLTRAPPPLLPSKDQVSPTKSSLATSRFKSSYDRENGLCSADTSMDERELPDGKSLHRHAKSVTFDAAPPQINEYEMITPDISSIGSNSREGSYESGDEYEDDNEIYENEEGLVDDSFDASLEDTDKTPVVGPEDWRHDTPDSDRFESSPMPEGALVRADSDRPLHGRTDSASSIADHRPLPPLPGMGHSRDHSSSPSGMSSMSGRRLGSQRSLPSPPPAISPKCDSQNVGNGTMSLEERFKLMGLSSDAKTTAELQRERRMRRAGARDRVESSQTPEPDSHVTSIHADDTLGDISGLDDYQLPSRISRESIMRRVNGNLAMERDSEFQFSSPAPSLSPEHAAPYDPDVPIPSTEDSVHEDDDISSEDSVIVKAEPEEDKLDVLALSEKCEGIQASQQKELSDSTHHSVQDTDSVYSEDPETTAKTTEQNHTIPWDDASNNEVSSLGSVSSPGRSLLPAGRPAENLDLSFKEIGEFKRSDAKDERSPIGGPEAPKIAAAHEYLERPFTPETLPLSKPEYDGTGWGHDEEFGDPGTPDSVIHHPVSDNEYIDMYEGEGEQEEKAEVPVRESPAIPERQATIKAPGSKLKTRVSATPSDIMAMREQRRQASHEVPVPPIPEKHRNRLSRDMEQDSASNGDDFLQRHPSFKKRSLTLDLDVGLSLDKDFDRVIENQKVEFQQLFEQSRLQAASGSPSRQASGLGAGSSHHGDDANAECGKQRGYMMRQNTKLVTASDKVTEDFRSALSASTSLAKQTRPQSWIVEPWNPAVQRRSTTKKRAAVTGPVPPLPGHESNARTLDPAGEDEVANTAMAEPATEDAGERGRLFVKVLGVKELDLPLPKSMFVNALAWCLAGTRIDGLLTLL